MIKLNKKGVSLVELMAAIVIIALASTTITTMIITTYRGQLRATQYQLAKEMAKTYDSMLSRDIIRANVRNLGMEPFTSSDPNDKFINLNQDLLREMTLTEDSDESHVSTI